MSRSLKLAALVSIGMVALLFAAVQQGRTLRAKRVLHQLPSTARALLRVDIGAVKRSAAAKTLLAAILEDQQLSEIETVCGFDPIVALAEATAWVRGPEEMPFQAIGLMLRGRSVDATTLADCHRRLVEARGGSIVRLDSPSGPLLSSRDRRSAVAALDARTIVTGSVATVAEAMAVWRGAAPSLAGQERIATPWPKVSAKAAISAILDPPVHWKSAFERAMDLGAEGSLLREVQTVALSTVTGRAQTIEIQIDLGDDELAGGGGELVRAWLDSPPKYIEPPWTEVLQTARVQVDRRRVVLTLDVASLSTAR